jgi:hypothetical protein
MNDKDMPGSGLATAIRIILDGVATLLALIGLSNFYRQKER